VLPSTVHLFDCCLKSFYNSFDSVTDLLEPVTDGRTDHCFISKSYDATSHFETAADDVLSLYTRITGHELDMNISADMNDEDM
jgi:Rab GDP dissociation inhibitor